MKKCFNYQKSAFTLAEVLITLGVIGVVAAITIPILTKNYQKTVLVNQLKKSVSMLEQGFQMAMTRDEVMSIEDTTLYKILDGRSTFNNDEFFNELNKYFKISHVKKAGFNEYDGYKVLGGQSASSWNNNTSTGVYFLDGSLLFIDISGSIESKDVETCNKIKELGGNLCSIVHTSYFDIDVNGDKKPNQIGRDRFLFILGNNGKLYPYGGKDFALFHSRNELLNNSGYWKNAQWASCGNSYYGDNGRGCAARIIENGWKMDY